MVGGAGSGKSVFAAQKILYRIMKERNHKFLVIRKVAKTQRNSCFQLFKDIISDWKLDKLADPAKTELIINFPAFNSQIIFLGLDDPEKLKSIAGITGIWIEESTELSWDDFKQINLRLRGITEFYKQIILTFNPIDANHWLKRVFFDTEQKKAFVLKTTYKDNKFLDEEYKQELESLINSDTNFYRVYCQGEWGVLENIIFNNWKVEKTDPEITRNINHFYGLDFGFTSSPSAFLKIGMKENTIYIMEEFYESKLTNISLSEKIKPIAGNNPVVCDCAEPKSIAELRGYGLNAIACKKGKDSIIHGIQWLKSKQIIIDPSCQNFINEISGYQFRKTKDGVILNEPVPLNDHLLDALRYAIEFLTNRRIIRIPSYGASAFGL
jgi:phage terminase large subunit